MNNLPKVDTYNTARPSVYCFLVLHIVLCMRGINLNNVESDFLGDMTKNNFDESTILTRPSSEH